MRNTAGAIHPNPSNRFNRGLDPLSIPVDSFDFHAALLTGDSVGLSHSDQLVRRERPGAHSTLMLSTMLLLGNPTSTALHIERTNPFRAMNFMRRQGSQINSQCLHRPIHFAD